MKLMTRILLPALALMIGCALAAPAEEYQPIQGEARTYTVASNDTLYAIARKFDVSIEQILVANGLSGISVPAGTSLLIPTRRITPLALERGLVLNLPARALYLYEDGVVTKVYPVAVGALGRWMTPTGDYSIAVLSRNPTWIPPAWAGDETPVPPGPSNPLGDRWIGLSRPGYGIHATNAPMSIGMLASHGCIRMYPEDAHDIFEHLDVGLPVKIIYRPILLGFDLETREFMLAVYPDVYGRGGNSLKDAYALLEEYGLQGLADDQLVARAVARRRGIPEPIINANVVVKVNGEVIDGDLPPILAGEQIIVTTAVFRKLGAQLEWNAREKLLTISYGGHSVTCNIGSKKALKNDTSVIDLPWAPRLFGDQTLVPLKAICAALEIPVAWNPEERAAEITAQAAPAPAHTPAARPPAHTTTARPTPPTPSTQPVQAPASRPPAVTTSPAGATITPAPSSAPTPGPIHTFTPAPG